LSSADSVSGCGDEFFRLSSVLPGGRQTQKLTPKQRGRSATILGVLKAFATMPM
jgi:hypothetical protein